MVQAGKIGKVRQVRCWAYLDWIRDIGNPPDGPVPPGVDYDMWLGPAPWAPYNSKRCSGSYRTNGDSWRSYKDYSGGGMTDWGAHHFGGATFAVDVRELVVTHVSQEGIHIAGLPDEEELEREIAAAAGEPEPPPGGKPQLPARFTRKSSGWK